MFNSKFQTRIMQVVKDRMRAAEEAHLDECERIDTEAEQKKEQNFESTVQNFLSKIL